MGRLTPLGGACYTRRMAKVTNTDKTATDVARRIKNVQGQLDGVVRMMDEGSDCVAVVTQFKAARAGLDRALSLFLQENLKRCVGADALSSTKKAEVESILTALTK